MIAVVGSLNMDLVINTKQIPRPGETVMGQDFVTICGGKGANQAVAAARAGGSVVMIGKVGEDDFGKRILDSLQESNIDCSLVEKVVGASTGVALISVAEDGNNSIIVSPEANYRMTTNDTERWLQVLEQADMILLQHEIPGEITYEIIDKMGEQGKCILLNPAPAQPVAEYLWDKIDFLIPNEHELAAIFPKKSQEETSIEEMASYLVQKGIDNVIVTLGEKGCIHFDKKGSRAYPAHLVKAVDTTAAGDTFVGAFAAYYAKQPDISKAIEFGMMAAAISVTRKGAQTSIPSLSEMKQQMGQVYEQLVKEEASR